MGELSGQMEDTFTHEYVVGFYLRYNVYICIRERREHQIFCQLLQMVPELEDRLTDGSSDDLIHVAELVRMF